MLGFRREDVPVVIEGEGVELRTQRAGAMSVAFIRAQKGTDLRPALRGLPDGLCPCPHWGYILKGIVRMHTRNGHQDYAAGQAFYWGPGHAPEAIEDVEYVDFSPVEEFEAVIRHILSQG